MSNTLKKKQSSKSTEKKSESKSAYKLTNKDTKEVTIKVRSEEYNDFVLDLLNMSNYEVEEILLTPAIAILYGQKKRKD